jgi:hypothetical protein
MKNIAIILVVVGIMMMAITGLNYAAGQQMIEAGALPSGVAENHTAAGSPYAGGLLLTIGLVLMMGGRRSLKSYYP